MPSGEYASASGGALRLKGAKVEKHRSKKHKKKRSSRDKDTEGSRARHAEDELEQVVSGGEDRDRKKQKSKTKDKEGKDGSDNEDYDDDYDDLKNDPYARMTPAERQFAEAQDKKIRDLMHASPEEARAARPELFKSHKERLADLNNYLSRLSEHNDMPKIGPG
ncbi:protein FAM32A [Sporothrix schenckii 1099-18]|uniref:Protein FAM32A n=1 Tax=Sporothrix schenckii 1099-18 TaxID=1397361 RepID=A0A0F2LST5_SPOSC|nr:protein FAM32A [Sporothrix schenckii 1099-18]KJR80548.1 protein FAM32A [Sporothrix schenckii 1099-18]